MLSLMQRTRPIALIALLAIAPGCGNDLDELDPIDPSEIEAGETFQFDGIVDFVDVEGGCWSILADGNTRFEPINLPEPFQKDDLRVRVSAKLRSDLGSFCQVGWIMEIVSIERL